MSAKGEKIVEKSPVFIGQTGGASLVVDGEFGAEAVIEGSDFGIVGELTLSSLNVLQGLSFFLQMGFTLILATFDGLDVGLLGDVIGENDCDDDG
nr:hypothetical protein [Tanacetum cinerariifolium]